MKQTIKKIAEIRRVSIVFELVLFSVLFFFVVQNENFLENKNMLLSPFAPCEMSQWKRGVGSAALVTWFQITRITPSEMLIDLNIPVKSSYGNVHRQVSVRRLMWLMSFFFLPSSPLCANFTLHTEMLFLFSHHLSVPPMDFAKRVSTCEDNVQCIFRGGCCQRHRILYASLPTVIFSEFITHETSDC